ncbi:AMP-binding protein [Paraburkholderia acidiphila]|uniref:Long-chain-fatty-acid--CoA ligase n=1 Tax=Paraburkholderia acidiphila TaxID=2571747 RepID=A0A7Z2JA67_9BURK|nr:AMP-binding protein [Paraburkholderia acidiphila]QGZ57547.1 AMP-binding protein [Paraburkholderia acidiphila]
MERKWLEQYPHGVPADIEPGEYESIADFLTGTAAAHPARTALCCADVELDYAAMAELSESFATYLQVIERLPPGSRVALMMPNVPQYSLALFGVLRAGMVVVNLNPHYTEREVRFHLEDSGAAILVAWEGAHAMARAAASEVNCRLILATPEEIAKLPFLRNAPARTHEDAQEAPTSFVAALEAGRHRSRPHSPLAPDAIAFLQYTGGTTGNPKAAVLTHRNVIANVLQLSTWLRPALDGADVCVVTVLPMYHIMALTGNCLLSAARGWKNVLIPDPRDLPTFVEQWRKHRFSFFVGVNTLFNALMDFEPFGELNFTGLAYTCGAGAAVQPTVAEKWRKLTGCALSGGYGLTEASPTVCMTPVGVTGREQTVGVPVPSTEVRLLDDEGRDAEPGIPGEIVVKGPQVMSGYWNRPEEAQSSFTSDAFVRTGDIAVMDEQGYVTIVDRKKDLVLVSGFNVYPNEIEKVVASHPDVSECACIGVQDAKTGEALKVFVVARDSRLTADALQAWCRKNLTSYKVPRQFEFRQALPKSTVGKILRRALR